MPDKNCIGLGPYAPAGGGSAPRAVFAKLLEKSRLRAALAAVSAEIDAALHALNPGEIAELQGLLGGEVAAADADVEAMQRQLAEEERLAKTVKPMTVRIPRRAAVVLAAEVEKRCLRGNYPSAESLIGEAVQRAFGS